MLEEENILCLAAAAWEGMWARAQQFMSIFASNGCRVLYVDPPVTYLSPLKNPALRGQAWDRWEQAGDRITVYSPPVILPFGNMYRAVNLINQKKISAGLGRVCRELDFRPTICWTYLPNTVDLPLPEDVLLVYDCADEHTAFPGLINKMTVSGMERELFLRAGVALTSARELYERKKTYFTGLGLVPNGADVEHFRRALEPGLDVPDEIASLPRPVVGYVGAVSSWLDQELLAAVARAHRDWTVILIGPVDTGVELLKSLPNVYFLGQKEYSLLPAYVKGFDVTVIPFKINDLTRGVNPVKLYEYLAAGRPVVSTALPEVLPFRPVVSTSLNPVEFVKMVEDELAGDCSEKAASRVQLARRHSWQARAVAVSEAITRFRAKLED